MSLLHPAFLWLGALALPLVALYLLKARRRRLDVTAVWLWESVQKDLEARVPLRKLRRDWLLWLQLLVLALLVLAAAGPFRRAVLGRGGEVAVVVDASASMLAGGRPARLESTLRRLVDELGPGDRMALIRAATRAEVLAPLTGDRRALEAALGGARPAPVPTSLTPAVELASTLAGEAGAVVVVTDASAVVPAAGDERLRVVRVGGDDEDGPLSNTGIVALGVRPSDSSGHDHQVFVRLYNSSERRARGQLVVRLGGQVRDAVELEIGPREEGGHTLRLTDAGEAPEGTVVEAVWKSAGDDALAADDRAFWVVQPPPDRRYRVAGPADPYLLRALESIAAERAGWRPAVAGEAVDLEILVGESPADEGPPFLWIDPREGRRDRVAAAAVLSWERTHPALRFVELRALRLGRVYRYDRPPGARVLAESTAGPLILEGTRGERRYLAWAFDPMETDLPLRVAYPLLVRHALEFLVPAEGHLTGGGPTGEPPAVPWRISGEGREVTLTSPSGLETRVPVAGGGLRLPPLEETGVWTLEGDGRRTRFATSLLNAEESDLAPRPERGGARRRDTTAGAGDRDSAPRDTLRGWWRPLVAVAIGLLLLEAFAFHRRWTF